MKTFLLINGSDIARFFANEISSQTKLDKVFVEDKSMLIPDIESRLASFKYTIKRLTGAKNVDFLREKWNFVRASREEKRVLRLERRLKREASKKYLNGIDTYSDYPVIIRKFGKLNSPEAVGALKSEEPDLLVVFGTSILKKEVINVAKIGVINIHTSILPRYRGSRVEFWQLLNEDYDDCGVTIHFIDEGVDTGDIIAQKRTPAGSGDNFFSLRYKNIKTAIALLPEVVSGIEKNDYQRKPQPKTSERAYRGAMITTEKKIEFYRRKGLL